MGDTSAQDDLASICSSLSSTGSVHASGTGTTHTTNEHLVDLLTRSRSRGGYGGRLNYSEFSTLATSLGWSSEDMDDCWYDIMMGEPSAEALDMTRVAECVCSYCLAAPLPLLEHYTLRHEDEASALMKEENAAQARALSTPSRPPALSAAQNDATVVLSPPSPKPPTAPQMTSPKKHLRRPSRLPAGAPARYAVETASSERRRRTTASPPPPVRPRTHSKSPARAASASPSLESNTVFFRLYENGMEQHRKRSTAKPAAADDVTAECTFQPKIVPYPSRRGDRAGETALFNKPTKSYFAKLVEEEEEARSDAIAHAPETPRVRYHPAPGPSSSVPAGYVEGVARLRRYVASRYENNDSKRSFRDPARTDIHRLVDAPILRLPVTVEGVTDAVDVRLASVHRHSPLRQQHHHVTYAERSEAPAAASTPRRPSPTAVRYKEHPVYY